MVFPLIGRTFLYSLKVIKSKIFEKIFLFSQCLSNGDIDRRRQMEYIAIRGRKAK